MKIRGTAHHVAEKYLQLARDAQTSGDPVTAENHFQHAEHYFRLIAAAQEQFRQQNPYYQPPPAPGEGNRDDAFDDGDDDDDMGQPMQQPMQQGQPMQCPTELRQPATALPATRAAAARRTASGRQQHQPQAQQQPQHQQPQYPQSATRRPPMPATVSGCHRSSPARSRRTAPSPQGFNRTATTTRAANASRGIVVGGIAAHGRTWRPGDVRDDGPDDSRPGN